jgi:hypothetical protein
LTDSFFDRESFDLVGESILSDRDRGTFFAGKFFAGQLFTGKFFAG